MSAPDAPAWFTNALATTPEVDETTVAGATISFRTWGEAATGRTADVLLVHGGAAHARWWDAIAPLLAVHRRVVALDMSGHGDSDHTESYSLDGWADELAAVISATGLGRRTVVIGHSLGGIVSAVLARRGSPALEGLVVVDSPIEPSGPGTLVDADNPAFGRARVYPTAAAAVERFRPIPLQSSLDYAAAHIASSSVREVEGGWGWKFDPRFVTMTGETPRTLDGLPCPVVFVGGEHGMLSSAAREAMQSSPEVSVVEIPDAGHAMMLDHPLALTAALRGVLAGWETSA